MDAAAVHDDLGDAAPVHLLAVPADDGLRHHGHMIRRVHKPGVVFFRLLRPAPATASPAARAAALLGQLAHQAGNVLAGVAQGHGHALRLLALVPPGQLRDPLGDSGIKGRQRHPAHRTDHQPVQRLPGGLAQIQAADGHGHGGLAMPAQAIQRPQIKVLLCLLGLVGLHPILPAPYRLVLADIFPGDVHVIFADGIDAGVHPRSVHRHAHGGDVPAHAHLARLRAALVPDMQLEGEAAHVILPPGVVQRAAYLLHGAEQVVPVEGIGRAGVVFKVAQRPDALPGHHILRGLQCRTGGPAAHHGGRYLAEHGDVPQGVDDVLQGVGVGPAVEVALHDLHPPHDAAPRLFIVQQPVAHLQLRFVDAPGDGGGALPLQDIEPEGFRLKLLRRGQRVPV